MCSTEKRFNTFQFCNGLMYLILGGRMHSSTLRIVQKKRSTVRTVFTLLDTPIHQFPEKLFLARSINFQNCYFFLVFIHVSVKLDLKLNLQFSIYLKNKDSKITFLRSLLYFSSSKCIVIPHWSVSNKNEGGAKNYGNYLTTDLRQRDSLRYSVESRE